MSRTLIYSIIVSITLAVHSCCYKSDCPNGLGYAINVDCHNLPDSERSKLTVYSYDKRSSAVTDSIFYVSPDVFFLGINFQPDVKDQRNYTYLLKMANGRQDTIYDINFDVNSYHCKDCGVWSWGNGGSLQYAIDNISYWYKQQKYTANQTVVLQP